MVCSAGAGFCMDNCPLELCLAFLLACWEDGFYMLLEQGAYKREEEWWCGQCEHCCVSITALGWELIAGNLHCTQELQQCAFPPAF